MLLPPSPSTTQDSYISTPLIPKTNVGEYELKADGEDRVKRPVSRLGNALEIGDFSKAAKMIKKGKLDTFDEAYILQYAQENKKSILAFLMTQTAYGVKDINPIGKYIKDAMWISICYPDIYHIKTAKLLVALFLDRYPIDNPKIPSEDYWGKEASETSFPVTIIEDLYSSIHKL